MVEENPGPEEGRGVLRTLPETGGCGPVPRSGATGGIFEATPRQAPQKLKIISIVFYRVTTYQ